MLKDKKEKMLADASIFHYFLFSFQGLANWIYPVP